MNIHELINIRICYATFLYKEYHPANVNIIGIIAEWVVYGDHPW